MASWHLPPVLRELPTLPDMFNNIGRELDHLVPFQAKIQAVQLKQRLKVFPIERNRSTQRTKCNGKGRERRRDVVVHHSELDEIGGPPQHPLFERLQQLGGIFFAAAAASIW